MARGAVRALVLPLCCMVALVACTGYAVNVRPVSAIHAGDAPITVLSYNIRIGAGVRQWNRSPYQLKDELVLDLESVAAAIGSVDPDVVALQEVLGRQQAAFLGKRLGMNYAYVPHGTDRYGAWWGVAILSRYTILKAERHEISYGRGNTKSIVIATLDLGGRQASFISIHKDKDLTDGASIRKALRRIDDVAGPVVLAGDLNIRPDDDRHRLFAGRFRDSAVEVDTEGARSARSRGTWIGIDGDIWGKRIDYVLVDPNYWSVVDAGLIPEAHWRASDHLGYFAKIVPRF